MIRLRTLVTSAALLALAACGDGGGHDGAPADTAGAVAAPPAAPAPSTPHTWVSNPAAGVAVTASGGESLRVETGPHAVLWPSDAGELAPPYTVRATLQKRAGRLHEGYGLVFGGSGLDGSESGQVYSYFLVRGDGSYLVKRRQGDETPVVRDWTAHAAIARDDDDGGRPHALEVQVTDSEVVFRVGGAEVARVPASELSVRGRAGIRTSHDVELEVTGFEAASAGPAAPPALDSVAAPAP